MQKLKYKRKKWLDRHSRVPDYSRFKRQAVYTSLLKSQRSLRLGKVRKKLSYLKDKGKYTNLEAPKIFSLSENPEDVLLFYQELQNNVMEGKPVFLDLSSIDVLTIDAIMYFQAIIQDFTDCGHPCAFKGNFPTNRDCNKLLVNSGFLKSVDSKVHVSMKTDVDSIKIIKGEISDPSVVKQICKFTIEKLSVDRLKTQKLYDIISELMTNTRQWAYIEERPTARNWYIYAKYIESENVVRYTFLDTGKGIPSTIKKNYQESISDKIGFSTQYR